LWPPRTRGQGIDRWRSDCFSGAWLYCCPSSTSASTTWWTRSMVTSMWRWRWRSWSWWRGGAPGERLRLPHLPHDHARELVGVVVRGDADVDYVRGDEPHLWMLRGVLGLEDDLRLAAGRHVGVVRVHEHEVEEVRPYVVADDVQVIVDAVAVGLAALRREVAHEQLQRG